MNSDTFTAWFRQYPTIVICGVLSLAMLIAILVRGSGLSEVRDQMEQVAREGSRIDDNIKNAVDLEGHLTSLREIGGEVAGRLINPAELARNLQYFYRLESESGVRITDLNQRGTSSGGGDDDDEPTFVPVRYDIAVEGHFQNLIEFLYRIETGRHFARVSQIEIVRSQQADSFAIRLAINVELLGRS